MALEEAGVWGWKKDYRGRGVRDGTQWQLKIRYRDASVDSHGGNALPPKREYERFRRAVSEFLGDRDF